MVFCDQLASLLGLDSPLVVVLEALHALGGIHLLHHQLVQHLLVQLLRSDRVEIAVHSDDIECHLIFLRGRWPPGILHRCLCPVGWIHLLLRLFKLVVTELGNVEERQAFVLRNLLFRRELLQLK